jgi:hypothetical protein
MHMLEGWTVGRRIGLQVESCSNKRVQSKYAEVEQRRICGLDDHSKVHMRKFTTDRLCYLKFSDR